MYPQKLNQGSVYILSSLIFTFGCISLWLNIFFRINKFKEPDMEFTILLIVMLTLFQNSPMLQHRGACTAILQSSYSSQ